VAVVKGWDDDMTIKSAVTWIFPLLIILLLLPSVSEAKKQRIGAVTVVKGKVTVAQKGKFWAKRVKLGTPIYMNDRIRTDKKAKVRIVFIDQSIISIGSSSALLINEYVFQPEKKQRSSRLRLLWGKVKCYVNDFAGYREKKFNVATSTTIVGVRGTIFLVWVKDDNTTVVAAFDNIVEVANRMSPEDFIVLTPGLMSEIIAGKKPTKPILMTEEQLKRFQEGLLQQDQQKLDLTPVTTTTMGATTEETTTVSTTTQPTTTLLPPTTTTTTTTTSTTSTTTTTTSTTTTTTTVQSMPEPTTTTIPTELPGPPSPPTG